VSEPPPPRATQPPPDPAGGLPPVVSPGPTGEIAPPPASWGAARAFGALGAVVVLVFIEAAIVAAFDADIESLGARLSLQVALVATFIGVALVAAQPGAGLASLRALGLRRPRRPAIKASVLAYLAYIGAALLIAAVIQPEQEDVTRELGVDEGVLGAIVAGALIVVAAPVSEEIFFRGFMFAGIRRQAPFWVAAAIPSAIWGLFHYTGPESWGVCLQLAIFGIALCWLYERTGSLWPPIAVHAFNNALAFSILTS
jgi:uncharacterized protein